MPRLYANSIRRLISVLLVVVVAASCTGTGSIFPPAGSGISTLPTSGYVGRSVTVKPVVDWQRPIGGLDIDYAWEAVGGWASPASSFQEHYAFTPTAQTSVTTVNYLRLVITPNTPELPGTPSEPFLIPFVVYASAPPGSGGEPVVSVSGNVRNTSGGSPVESATVFASVSINAAEISLYDPDNLDSSQIYGSPVITDAEGGFTLTQIPQGHPVAIVAVKQIQIGSDLVYRWDIEVISPTSNQSGLELRLSNTGGRPQGGMPGGIVAQLFNNGLNLTQSHGSATIFVTDPNGVVPTSFADKETMQMLPSIVPNWNPIYEVQQDGWVVTQVINTATAPIQVRVSVFVGSEAGPVPALWQSELRMISPVGLNDTPFHLQGAGSAGGA